MIPALIRKMLDATGEVVLWGDGSPTREFLYVDDCADGLLLAAERYDGADAGQPRHGRRDVDPRARRDDRRRDRLHGRARLGQAGPTMPNGQPRRQLDASRAEQLFGFRARTALRDGLERTVAWYRESSRVHA